MKRKVKKELESFTSFGFIAFFLYSLSFVLSNDLTTFDPLKRYFYSSISQHIKECGPNITVKDIPKILEVPWKMANSLHNIKSDFRKSGVDLDWIEKNKAAIEKLLSQGKILKFDVMCERVMVEASLSEFIENLARLNLSVDTKPQSSAPTQPNY